MNNRLICRLLEIKAEIFSTNEGEHSFCNIAMPCMVVVAIIWAMIVQNSVSIPVVHSINLIWWQWTLPFKISRIWDLLLIPAFIFLIAYIKTSPTLSDYYEEGPGMIGSIMIITGFISTVFGLIFGSPYSIIFFVILTPAFFIILIACIVCISLTDVFRRKVE